MSPAFLRSDIIQLTAYSSHPGEDGQETVGTIDHLDTNECPYDLPVSIKDKLGAAAAQTIAANRYPDGAYLDLKGAIADYANESSQLPGQFTAANITVGNGSDELIRSLLMVTCLGGGGSVLVANPTFSMYAILARTLGIPVIPVDRDKDNFAINLEAAQQVIDHPPNLPVRVVFMVHPNSPTGNGLTAQELAWLKQLPEDILVVVDEAYFEFSQQTTLEEIAYHSNWLVLRTFSKAFRLAAYRVGYGIAQPEVVAALEKVRLPYNLPSIAQTAARLALTHRQDLLAIVPEIQQQRQILLSSLGDQGSLLTWPSLANFIYTRPQVEQDTMTEHLDSWFRYLKREGTFIRNTGGGLRITVGSPEENQRTLNRIRAQALH
ncbi:MAG: histidinol-phosphate transaminase [Nodosilinea sp.]